MIFKYFSLDILFLLPFYSFLVIFLIVEYKKRKENFFKCLSLMMFIYALSESLKLGFKIPREGFFSPYRFPSSHSAVSFLIFLLLPNKWRFWYLPLFFYVVSIKLLLKAHKLIDILAGVALALIGKAIFDKARKRIGRLFQRKCFHFFIIVILFLIYINFTNLFPKLMTLTTFLGVFLLVTWRKIPIIRDFVEFYDPGRKGLAAFLLSLGVFLASFLSLAYMEEVLFYSFWVDFGASMGRIAGKKRKSVEGLLISYVFLFVPFILTKKFNPLFLLLPLVEFASGAYDNLTLPLSISIFSLLFPYRGITLQPHS